jgi:hypothetical protein
MSKEGKTCVEIQWFAPDAGGPVGIWREMKLPSNADRLRISMRKRGSCPRARLDLQVGMAGRPVRFYPVRLQDLSTGWVTKELDLETRTPQPGAALHQSEVEAVFAILSLEGRGDVLVDQLECRVVERR